MIGPALRAAREARGLSIEDIKVTTLMMVKQIEDLENDKFENFSAPVYTRGFIKLYARAVGLDPNPLMAEYMATYGAGNSDNRQPVVPLEMATEAGAPLEVVTPVVPESERDHVAIPDPAAVHNHAPEPQPMPKPAAPAPAEAPAAAAPEKPEEKTPEPDLLQLMEATPAPESAAPAAPAAEETPEKETPAAPAGKAVAAAAPLPTPRASQPQPVKRVAPAMPGAQPPEFRTPQPRIDAKPVAPQPAAVKKLPEPESPVFQPHGVHAATPGTLPRPVSATAEPLTLGAPASAYAPKATPAAAAPAAAAPAAEPGRPERHPDPAHPGHLLVESPAHPHVPAHSDPLPVKRPAPEPTPLAPLAPQLNPVRMLLRGIGTAVAKWWKGARLTVRTTLERIAAANEEAKALKNNPEAMPAAKLPVKRLRLSRRGRITICSAAGVLALLIVIVIAVTWKGEDTPAETRTVSVENTGSAPATESRPAEEQPLESALPPPPVQRAPVEIAPIFLPPYTFAS